MAQNQAPARRRQNIPNINVTTDDKGNQYIRHTTQPFGGAAYVGRLGSDVEIDTFDNGSVRGQFTLAHDWQDYGEQERTTGWIRVTVWGEAAQALAKNLNKGDQFAFSTKQITTVVTLDSKGKIILNDNGLPRVIEEVTVDDFQLLGNRRSGSNRSTSVNVEHDEDEVEMDDVPF